MRLYDWAMVIISYFLSFSYHRTMQIWKQKKKERMSLGLDLWWPNWLRRSKRERGACEEEAGYNFSNFLKPRGIHAEKRGGSGAGARVLGFFSFFLTYTHTHQRIKEEDGSLRWHVSGASLFISTQKGNSSNPVRTRTKRNWSKQGIHLVQYLLLFFEWIWIWILI